MRRVLRAIMMARFWIGTALMAMGLGILTESDGRMMICGTADLIEAAMEKEDAL